MNRDKEAMQQFEWSVRALAQAPAVQRDLFPDFVEVADELALDFEERYRRLPTDIVHFTPDQAQRVNALDSALAAMSGPAHEELWTMEALDEAPEWDHIRQLARELIQAMGWSNSPPPSDRGAIYV